MRECHPLPHVALVSQSHTTFFLTARFQSKCPARRTHAHSSHCHVLHARTMITMRLYPRCGAVHQARKSFNTPTTVVVGVVVAAVVAVVVGVAVGVVAAVVVAVVVVVVVVVVVA